MANLDGLKIKQAPKAFAEMALMHNALCDLIASLEGSLGIDIHVTPPTRRAVLKRTSTGGKIRIGQKKIAGQNSSTGGGGGSSGASTIATELHYSHGGVTIDIDGNGVILNSGSFYIFLDAPGGTFRVGLASGSRRFLVDAVNGTFQYSNAAGTTCTIDDVLLTHSMSIQTIAVCNSGSPASQLVLASAPF